MTSFDMSLDSTEARLRGALEIDPPAEALRFLDARMRHLVAEHGAPPEHRAVRRPAPWRWALRPLPLLLAFALLAGAAVAGMTLLGRIATASPGWATAWELAEVIGESQSDQGYTVTLERAYADINQVVAFVNVTADDPSLPDPGEGGSVWLNGGVTDASGRQLEATVSTMAMENGLVAYIGMWVDPTPQAGTYVVEFSSIEALPADFTEETLPAPTTGTWRFEFELPQPTGVAVEPAATATHDGLTVELAELRLAPSMLAGRMYLTVDGEPGPAWAATIEEVIHDGETVSADNNADYMSVPLLEDGASGIEFRTAFGADSTSGTWEFRISQITFMEFDPATGGQPESHTGDWVLTVVVP